MSKRIWIYAAVIVLVMVVVVITLSLTNVFESNPAILPVEEVDVFVLVEGRLNFLNSLLLVL